MYIIGFIVKDKDFYEPYKFFINSYQMETATKETLYASRGDKYSSYGIYIINLGSKKNQLLAKIFANSGATRVVYNSCFNICTLANTFYSNNDQSGFVSLDIQKYTTQSILNQIYDWMMI